MAGTAFGAPAFTRPAVAAPRPALTSPGLAFSGSPAAITALNKPPAAPSPIKPLATTDMVNPGYGEQALNLTQNRLGEDPYADTQAGLVKQAQQPSAGQEHLDANLGALDGPGNVDQYWQAQQGQFNDPFAGEQFTREATQNYSPTGPAGAFNTKAQGNYDALTGYSGPQAAAGQYGANASSGPLAGQSYYDQYGGGLATTGTYSDPNLAAGQYSQTQGAFGAMPLPDSADPYYDRAIQLGTQSYNQGAAGRGVYGSSEALSGVGNVITDLNAKRAQTAFGNQMAIETEQRMRQQLLGEQARAGDLSSLSAFDMGLKGVETYGKLAETAGAQTLGQQTMLGNQANDVDDNAQAAQTSNIAGTTALGNIANDADARETDRYRESTGAMNAADKTQIDRVKTGADIGDMADDNARGDFDSATTAANLANDNRDQGLATASNIAHTGSADDLARVNALNDQSQDVEGQRQTRGQAQADNQYRLDKAKSDILGSVATETANMSQTDFENWLKTEYSQKLTDRGIAKEDQQQWIDAATETYNAARNGG